MAARLGHPLAPGRRRPASIAGWRAAGEPTLTAWGYHHLGQLQRAQGRLEAALGTYRQVLEVAATPDGPLPAAAIGHVGMAEVAYQRNQLQVALEQVTEGIRQGRQLGYRQPLATGLATLAWIRQATGDPAGALAAMGEAEAAGPSAGVTDLLNPVPVLAARLLLAAGDQTAAAAWAREHRLAPDDRPDYPHERAYLLWPGCWWPATPPTAPSGCSSTCTPWPWPSGAPAASSRSGPCRPWPWPPPGMRRPPWPP